MPDSIFGDIAELGERAVAFCAGLEEMAENIRRVKDGDDALALAYGIEVQIKAIKKAAGDAQKARDEALTSRLRAREANRQQLSYLPDAVADRSERLERMAGDLLKHGRTTMPMSDGSEATVTMRRTVPDGVDPDTGEIK